MLQRFLLFIAVLALGASPALLAQEEEIPTIAMLNFGHTQGATLSIKGAFDMMQAYGYLSQEERAALEVGEDFYGENLNVLWRNAGFDIPTANLMVEDALDRDVDALLTLTTQVTQIAVNATRDMDDPPAIMFSLVGSPYYAGIADAPCIKPSHVGGTQNLIPFEEMVQTLLVQDPDLKVFGAIVSPDQPVSVDGARQIQMAADELGLRMEVATVISRSDLNLAVEAVVNRGAEAILYPIGSIALSSTPLLLNLTAEYGIPLYAPVPYQVFNGATIGTGNRSTYSEGVIQGRMLVAHLNGDMHISEISINQSRAYGIAVNLDSAKAQGVEIAEDILAMAEYVIEDGVSSAGATIELPEVVTSLPEMPLEERHAADLAFLEGLRCTPDIIAEQRAQLQDFWAEE